METVARLLPALAVVILVLAGAGIHRWLGSPSGTPPTPRATEITADGRPVLGKPVDCTRHPPSPDQDTGDCRAAAALATARVVMFRVRRTVAAGVRIQAVAAAPIRIGPTVTPPLVVVLSTV
ncbi:hypothetical protein SAMN05421783_12025 [Thiocapsa roseopersicina]|uniref:Uncharacterized protein n=1 Tax=Thiocapsa roseopersicina TaxID=1058 RepID=A0A1H3AKV0_THIRO|nr:hypothetical protein SAMN05421783_12025 [Thiocapsa roseopersicina]